MWDLSNSGHISCNNPVWEGKLILGVDKISPSFLGSHQSCPLEWQELDSSLLFCKFKIKWHYICSVQSFGIFPVYILKKIDISLPNLKG